MFIIISSFSSRIVYLWFFFYFIENRPSCKVILCTCYTKAKGWSEVKVAQLCLTLCNPMDYRLWNSTGQDTGMRSLSLLQRIFPTQRSNPGLPHCRQFLYQLSHKGRPRGAVSRIKSDSNHFLFTKVPTYLCPWQVGITRLGPNRWSDFF